MVFKLLYDEGFFVGASSGLNVAAAVELSKSMPKGSTIVTCICDNGQKYFNRLFNRNELAKRGLLDKIPKQYQKNLFLK